jgi:predicted membrane protein
MSSKRSNNLSWGSIILVAILVIIAFLLLPKWLQILIVLLGLIALIEAISRIAFDFSPIKWLWDKITNN